MRFTEFSKYLERLEATASRLEITKILAQLLSKLEKEEIEAAVFLSLGDLGPRYDNPDTGLSDRMMIRVIARAFSKKDEEVSRLFKSQGDLGQVGQSLGSEIKNQKSNIKVKEVFEKLNQVAAAAGAGSQEKKINLMSQLIQSLDPLSVRYLIRIPLGTMRLGFSEKTVLEALTLLDSGEKEASFAKDSPGRQVKESLEQKFEVYPNIGQVARVFRSKGLKGLSEIRLKVGVPVSPMLCARLDSAAEMIEKMGKVAAEYKYDGTRLQVHLDREVRSSARSVGSSQMALLDGVSSESEERVKMFTRNMEEVSAMFPDVAEAVIKEIRAEAVILDGEAVGFDPQTGRFLPFQETSQRKRKYDIAEMAKKIPVKYFVFDILLKDGQDLTNLPLYERRKILAGVVKKNSEKILLSQELVTEDPEELTEYFQQVKQKGLEGLVVKKYDGIYQAGNRGFNWVKFKREETGSLSDTVDCIVLGYYKGTGKRAGFGIGAFLTGIYDEEKSKILTIAKIGTGLTDDEWRKLKVEIGKLSRREVGIPTGASGKFREIPKNVEIPKELMPDVLCQPKIVVAIRADEITVSPSHSSGYALRFPRMMGYRPDKSFKEATTLKEVRNLYKLQKRR